MTDAFFLFGFCLGLFGFGLVLAIYGTGLKLVPIKMKRNQKLIQ